MPQLDDVLQFLIQFLRRISTERNVVGRYGYDLYIPNACRAFAREVEGLTLQQGSEIEQRLNPLSGIFYEAAWELCRRGIIRPGVRGAREQSTDDGSAGNGYSVTTQGHAWLSANEDDFFVPIEPGRTAALLGEYADRFGQGFLQRSQEAMKCYSSSAYLACCAMCGAAAESMLLSIAVTKIGDEDQVLRTYKAANGRRETTNQILHGLPQRMRDSFLELTALLNYWRDEAAHGTASDISEFEAYEAIARLLRFAHFSNEHFDELTA